MIEIGDLALYSIFKDLSAEELEHVRHLIFERDFRAGNTLFMEGMQGEVFYLVKKGKIEILKKKGHEDLVIAILGPGDFVGEMSVIDKEPRSATARVAEEATLLILTKNSFQDILQAIPSGANKVLLAILRIVNHRLREANRKLASG